MVAEKYSGQHKSSILKPVLCFISKYAHQHRHTKEKVHTLQRSIHIKYKGKSKHIYSSTSRFQSQSRKPQICFPFMLLSFMKLRNREGIGSRSTIYFATRCRNVTLRFSFYSLMFWYNFPSFSTSKTNVLFLRSPACHLALTFAEENLGLASWGTALQFSI